MKKNVIAAGIAALMMTTIATTTMGTTAMADGTSSSSTSMMDINGDGKIDIFDLSILKSQLSKGEGNVAHAVKLQRYLLGYKTSNKEDDIDYAICEKDLEYADFEQSKEVIDVLTNPQSEIKVTEESGEVVVSSTNDEAAYIQCFRFEKSWSKYNKNTDTVLFADPHTEVIVFIGGSDNCYHVARYNNTLLQHVNKQSATQDYKLKQMLSDATNVETLYGKTVHVWVETEKEAMDFNFSEKFDWETDVWKPELLMAEVYSSDYVDEGEYIEILYKTEEDGTCSYLANATCG